jgi:concanavalin A-like lectin/glucanase superfamily protein
MSHIFARARKVSLFVVALAFVLGFGTVSRAHATTFQVDSSGTLTTNLVSYYKLDTDGTDSFGTNTLTNNGSVSFSSGKISNAADGGSSNTSKSLTTSSTLGIDGGNFSMNFWVNVTTAPTSGNLVFLSSQGNGASSNVEYDIDYYNNSGTLTVRYIRNRGSSGAAVVNDTTALTTGVWYMLTLTYDGSVLKAYRNGSSVGSTSATSTGSGLGFTGFGILSRGSGAYNFSGMVDEEGIWSKALSQQEITDLYGGGCGDPYGGTVICHPDIETGTLQQYEPDAATTIPEGAGLGTSAIVFGATLDAPASNTVQLQVEVVTSTGNFTGTPTATSPSVASGQYASTSVSGLSNGSYYWRARAKDSQNATSTWTEFGTAGVADFKVALFPVDTLGTLTTGLKSYYKLEDTSDAFGTNVLTNTNSVAFNPGKMDKGADGGASNTNKSLTTSNALGIDGGNFSMNFWVNVTTAPTSGNLAFLSSQGNGAGTNIEYDIDYYNDAGTPTVRYIRNKGSNGAAIVNDATALTTGTWYMLTLTYDGSTLKAYRNGSLISSTAASGNGLSLGFTGFGILSRGNGTYNLSGLVDEEGIWSKALSSQEVTDLYNGGCGDPLARQAPTGCLVGLNQYKSNAVATIAAGASTTENTVVFRGILASSGTSTLQLQIEVTSTANWFSGIANVTSSFVSPGTNAAATFSGGNGGYHWRARVLENGTNTTSTWQSFGPNTTSTDFVIDAPISAYFNGSSAWGYSAASDTFAASDPFTIEFWYNTQQPTSTIQGFIDSHSTTTGTGYYIERDQDKGIHFVLGCATGTIDFHAAADSANQIGRAATDSNGVWHHVGITKSNGTTTAAFTFYFDNVKSTPTFDSSGPISGNCFTSSSTDRLWLGAVTHPTSTDFYTGETDEVRIWDVEQSSSSVTGNRIYEDPATSTNLMGHWTFNDFVSPRTQTSTDSASNNSITDQIGSIAYSYNSPFRHFLWGGTSVNPDTRQILWHYDSPQTFIGSINYAVGMWNGLTPIVLASTTATTSLDLEIIGTSTTAGDWAFTPALTVHNSTRPDFLYLNSADLHTGSLLDDDFDENAVLHELGHALGLDHSYLGNVMYYFVANQTIPGQEDIDDYHFLWGY